MKTQSGSTSRRTIAVIACIGLAGVLGLAFGLKQFLSRPTDNTLRYVPSDAVVVLTFDATPHPSQVAAFATIRDSLKSHGYDKSIQDTVFGVLGSNPLYKELRPLIKGGVVFYLDGSNIKDPSKMGGFFALSVSDAAAANQALKSHGPVQYYKGVAYIHDHEMFMTVLDDQLVFSNSEKELYKMKQVKEGEISPITTSSEFQEANKDIDPDSNLSVFISLKDLGSLAKGKLESAPEWVSCGLSIRDNGLNFTMATKNDFAKHPEEKIMAGAPPLRSDLFEVLPSGSYGLFAMSGLSQAIRAGLDSAKKDQTLAPSIDDAEKQVAKVTGLSLESDLAKASGGNSVLAFYPTDAAHPSGLDMLVVADDQNGADPAGEFKKYEAYVEKQLSKSSDPSLFVKKSVNGVEEYALSNKIVDGMVNGFGEEARKAYKDKNSMFANKTLAVALIGKTVVCSTSQALLDRTVASYQSKKDNLASDSTYSPYVSPLLGGNQSLMIVSVSRVATSVKAALAANKEANGSFKAFLDVLERLKAPMTVTGKISADGLTTGSSFIPMDYAALIDAIEKATHRDDKQIAMR